MAEASPDVSQDRVAALDNPEDPPPFNETEAKETIHQLENRVAGLEAQIKKLTEKHARESEIATESINNKNGLIDVMRIKLNRYEFAVKEAILFLGKPMLNYEEWLMRGGGSGADASAGNGNGTYDAVRSEVGSTASKTYSISEVKVLTPGQMAEKQQAQKASDFDSMALTARGPGAGPPNFEVQCMECMRLALNYLKNAQASVSAMSPGGPRAPSLPKLNVEGLDADGAIAESMMLSSERMKQPSRSRDASPGRRHPSTTEKSSGMQTPPHGSQAALLRSQRSFSGASGHDRALSAQRTASALFNAATSLPEDDESDLATNLKRSSLPSTPTSGGKCANCRETLLQLHQHQEAIEGLKRDITDLADELEEERAARDRLQSSKDILDQELEELTAQLFDQANRMVIDEAKMRDQLEQHNRQLRGELGEVAQKFHRRDEELRALRAALRALEAAKLRSTSHSNLPSSAISPTSPLGSLSNLTGTVRRGSSMRHGPAAIGSPYGSNPTLALNYYPTPTLTVDGIIFSEFQDHVKDSMSTGAPAALAYATNFVKRCMAEDIEPCLFYVYHQDSGGLFKQSGLSTSGRKKLLDNVMRGACEIGPVWSSRESVNVSGGKLPSAGPASPSTASQPSSTASPHSSSSSSPHSKPPSQKAKCLTCTLVRDCDYKIRFPPLPKARASASQNNLSPTAPTAGGPEVAWHPLCRFCRDRVLAVLEFFAFLAHIRDGVKQGATLLGMFRQALWLRRRMAVCRIGSTALFEGDVPAAGYATGGTGRFEAGGEWEKWVHIMT
ncbi:hypothetical protein DFJ77DRAFT_474390 [Powellomyces hirtus]|nr:hypothetical protein DFJ77DRAFT_474390 [Powellomyces hirtus]